MSDRKQQKKTNETRIPDYFCICFSPDNLSADYRVAMLAATKKNIAPTTNRQQSAVIISNISLSKLNDSIPKSSYLMQYQPDFLQP